MLKSLYILSGEWWKLKVHSQNKDQNCNTYQDNLANECTHAKFEEFG